MKQRAFTLTEVLVALGLLLLLGALLVRILFPTFNLSHQRAVQTELQTTGSLALTRLTQDLRNSTPASVSFADNLLGCHRLADLSIDGDQVWEERLVVYRFLPEEKTLERVGVSLDKITVKNASTAGPLRLQPSELSTVAELPINTRLTFQSVVQFQVDSPESPNQSFQQPLTLRLKLEKEIFRPTRRILSAEFERTVFLLNKAH